MAVTTATRTPSTVVYLEPGDATTCLVGADVVYGHFVKVTTGGVGNHPKIITAVAAGPSYGVAHFSAVAGTDVSVLRVGTIGVIAGAAITSGSEVEVGALGVAVTLAAGKAVGVATADIANGALGPITLYA